VSERVLIVNADDFGASAGINDGIVEAHAAGIVTSTSLMVMRAAAAHAVALAREHPALGIGLHLELDAQDRGPAVTLGDADSVRAEIARQLEAFGELVGRPPTHVDSHHHVHREPEVGQVARELVAPLGVPLREDGSVTFVGGFYGQWEYGVTDLSHVSPDFLSWILRHEIGEGWTELGCHPGRVRGDFTSSYLHEREVELATLTDPRVGDEINALGIRLASYAELSGQAR
jgi:predicted glycoside hydrolase/deacetylase ChbG (UPF0249 family)